MELPGEWKPIALPDWLSNTGERYWVNILTRARIVSYVVERRAKSGEVKKERRFRLFRHWDHEFIAEFRTKAGVLKEYAQNIRYAE